MSVQGAAGSAMGGARRAGESDALENLARVGMIAFGLVHLLVAWLALKSIAQTRRIASVWPVAVGVLLGIGMSAPAWLALLDYVSGSARQAQASSAHFQWLVPPAASELAADAVLADGTTVRIRPVHTQDEPELGAMLDGLSQHSRLLRFFTGGANLREAAALAATAPGVVALAGDPEHVVGHALYVRDRPGSAEVAFEVAQSWHGRGVGTVLLGAVAQRAAAVFAAALRGPASVGG